MSDDRPVKAWTLPSSTVEHISVVAAAISRALAREEAGAPRNRAYVHCRRWHRRWRSRVFVLGGKPMLDCTRCGLRWVW